MVKNLWAKISFYLFLGILILVNLIFGDRVNASTSIGIYAGFNGYNGSCSENGYFNYDKLGANVQGNIYWEKGAINNAISGKAKNISIAFKYDLSANTTYDVTINFYGNDLTNKLKLTNFIVYKTNGCGQGRDYNDSTLNLVSFTNKATSSSNTSKLKFRISTLAVIGDWEVQLLGDNNYITSVSNFGIKSVTIEEVDTSGNNALIENDNNNTQSIINNNNQNTQDIIDNQNNLLGDKCANINEFSNQSWSSNNTTWYYLNGSSGAYGSTIGNNTTYKWSVSNGKKYSIKVDTISNVLGAQLVYGDETTIINGANLLVNGQSFTSNQNGYVLLRFRVENGQSVNIKNIMFNEGNVQSYCQFGSYISKQDKTTDAVNSVNDTMKDSSVDSPNDFISDMEDMLPTNSTITQLIGLPISLYQKILSNINGTCSSMNLGSLYGTNLIMPCIDIDTYLGSTLWNTIDLIISGIFVLTIAKKMIKAFNNFTFMKEGDVIND